MRAKHHPTIIRQTLQPSLNRVAPSHFMQLRHSGKVAPVSELNLSRGAPHASRQRLIWPIAQRASKSNPCKLQVADDEQSAGQLNGALQWRRRC